MRAYACAREGVIVDIFTLRKIQFLVGDSSVFFPHPNILGKQHVTFHKTTRRFHKNKPLFLLEHHGVFIEISRRFMSKNRLLNPNLSLYHNGLMTDLS